MRPSIIRGLILFLIKIAICSVVAENSHLSNSEKEALVNEINRIKVNKSVDPCTNFYEYTCGGTTHYGKYLHHLKQNPEDVLARYFNSDTSFTNAEQKGKDFFTSCRGPRYFNKLKQLDIYKITGGWPLIEPGWSETKFDLPITLAEFRKIGINIFIDLSIATVNNQKVIYIRPSRKYHPFQEDEVLQFYNTLSSELPKNTVDNVLSEFRVFAGQRADTDAEPSHQIPDYIAVKRLKELIEFDWDQYFETFLGKNLEENNKVVLHEPEELRHILRLAAGYDKKIIANFIWSVFVVDANKMCFELFREYFPTMYAKLIHCPPFDEDDIIRMLHEFQSTYEVIIKNGRWSIPGNHALVSELFKSIHDWTRYITAKVESEYGNLHMDIDNFYRNIVTSGFHKTVEETSDLYYVMNLYQAPVLSLYEYYQFMGDSNYNKKLPMSMNYARLGTIFGFYAIRLWNNSVEWQTDEHFRDQYTRLKTCLSKHVYFPPNKPQDENLQDVKFFKEGGDPMHWTVILNGAVKLAYESYNNWLKDNTNISMEENVILRDYHLNNKRLFFLAHASIYCTDGKYLSSAINAELMNLPEFSEAFQCPSTSRMNPSSKCRIW